MQTTIYHASVSALVFGVRCLLQQYLSKENVPQKATLHIVIHRCSRQEFSGIFVGNRQHSLTFAIPAN